MVSGHCPLYDHDRPHPASRQDAQTPGLVCDFTAAYLKHLLHKTTVHGGGYQGSPCCLVPAMAPFQQALGAGDYPALVDLTSDLVWQMSVCAQDCPALLPLLEVLRVCHHHG